MHDSLPARQGMLLGNAPILRGAQLKDDVLYFTNPITNEVEFVFSATSPSTYARPLYTSVQQMLYCCKHATVNLRIPTETTDYDSG